MWKNKVNLRDREGAGIFENVGLGMSVFAFLNWRILNISQDPLKALWVFARCFRAGCMGNCAEVQGAISSLQTTPGTFVHLVMASSDSSP